MVTIRTAPTTGARGFAQFVLCSGLRHRSHACRSHTVASGALS
jgi:hypothetical protein